MRGPSVARPEDRARYTDNEIDSHDTTACVRTVTRRTFMLHVRLCGRVAAEAIFA